MSRRSPAGGPWPEPRSRACSRAAPECGQPFDEDREPNSRERNIAEPRQQAVITSAGHQLAVDAGCRVVQLEHHAGVIVEAPPERGRESDAAQVEGVFGDERVALLELIEGFAQ